MDDNHHKLYKINKSTNETRTNRLEDHYNLRKKKRKENLCHHRNIHKTSELNDENHSDYLLSLAAKAANTFDRDGQLIALRSIRKMISSINNKNIKDVIDTDIIPTLIDCLSYHDHFEIQYEALWIIINIAAGSSEDTYMIIQEGGVQSLFILLSSNNENLRELSIWAFGNIVGDGPLFRDYVLQYDILSKIEIYLNPNTPEPILINIAWLLLNLCRHKNPSIPILTTHRILDIIERIVLIDNKEITINLIWAISYICEIGEQEIQMIIDNGFIPIVLQFLNSTSNSSLMAALRTIGGIVNGSNDQAQTVINYGIIENFSNFLTHPNPDINKQVMSIILNITVGKLGPNQDAIDKHLMAPMIALLKESSFEIQKDIIYALRNITLYGDNKIILRIFRENAIDLLCKLLVCQDNDVIILILEIFDVLIEHLCNELKEIPFVIEFYGGRQLIENLLTNENIDIRNLAKKLIEKHFTYEKINQVEMDLN